MRAAHDFAGFGVPVAVARLPRQDRGERRDEIQADPRDDDNEVDIVQSDDRHRCITDAYNRACLAVTCMEDEI